MLSQNRIGYATWKIWVNLWKVSSYMIKTKTNIKISYILRLLMLLSSRSRILRRREGWNYKKEKEANEFFTELMTYFMIIWHHITFRHSECHHMTFRFKSENGDESFRDECPHESYFQKTMKLYSFTKMLNQLSILEF